MLEQGAKKSWDCALCFLFVASNSLFLFSSRVRFLVSLNIELRRRQGNSYPNRQCVPKLGIISRELIFSISYNHGHTCTSWAFRVIHPNSAVSSLKFIF
jgi:hypothetical protein